MNYPATVIGTVVRLQVSFRDRSSRELISMTGGSANVRVVSPAGAVTNAACVISGTAVYYDWDTAGLAAGRYQIEFDGTPDDGLLFIEPYEPITISLRARLGS